MKDNNRCDKFSCINKYICQAIGFVAGAGFSWQDIFFSGAGEFGRRGSFRDRTCCA